MKQITIKHDDKQYTLEFTRNSVRKLEQAGFVIQDIQAKPATLIPMLFEGAFVSKHKYIKKDVVEEIYNNLENKDEIIGALAEMYQDTLLSIISNTDEELGNLKWEKNW